MHPHPIPTTRLTQIVQKMEPKYLKLMKEAEKHIYRKHFGFYDLFSLNLYATITPPTPP